MSDCGVSETRIRTLNEVEKEHIHLVFALHRGNVRNIAHSLGIARSTLYRKMLQHRIPKGFAKEAKGGRR